MAESKELNRIKKLYGEKFMHLCRRLFPTLLEQEGLLTKILEENFSTNSRTLGEDITEEMEEDFKNFIFSKVNVEKEQIEVIEKKTPYELLKEVGYELYECNSEEEIQSFKRYYKPGEVLCTFGGGRLDSCVVFWAVKKDADKIIRGDFERPKREDKYGTSVMSIQFTRGKTSTVSIKNRYNHTVNNPDATYGNDLDRIVPGLKQSFAELLAERGMELDASNIEKLYIPNYVVANDGKYYKYNMEINGIYYCPGNVIIDHGEVKQLESEKEVLMDYFILDKEKKTLRLYDSSIQDSFIDSIENIEKIEMIKNPDKEKQTRLIKIKTKDSDKPIVIEIDKDNNIVGYENQELKKAGDRFLVWNSKLSKLDLPQLAKTGDYFLCNNVILSELNTPQLKEVGDYFLRFNKALRNISLQQLEKVGNHFLGYNEILSELNTPQLKEIGDYFLRFNKALKNISLPQLEKVGNHFLGYNEILSELNTPQLKEVGDHFLGWNKALIKLQLPQLTKVGDCFLEYNEELETLNTPKLTEVGKDVLIRNKKLTKLNLPQLKKAGRQFLLFNETIKEVNLPQLTNVEGGFLQCNEALEKLNLPQLTKVGERFLMHNENIKELKLPQLKEIGDDFLSSHPKAKELIANMNKESEEEINESTSINPKDIVELDTEKQLTTTEVSLVRKIIEKIKSVFHKKDNSQR